jgi:hypothetical protein
VPFLAAAVVCVDAAADVLWLAVEWQVDIDVRNLGVGSETADLLAVTRTVEDFSAFIVGPFVFAADEFGVGALMLIEEFVFAEGVDDKGVWLFGGLLDPFVSPK